MTQHKTYKSLTRLLLNALTYCLGSFYFGYSMGYFNAIDYSQLHSIFEVQIYLDEMEGIISGTLPFGALFGAFLANKIMCLFSRKQTFLVTDTLTIIACILTLSASLPLLLIGRFLQGLSVGIFSTIVSITLKEHSPIELSGFLCSLPTPCIGFGFLTSYILPYIFDHHYHLESYWRISFSFGTLITLLQAILISTIFKNETIKWLLVAGKRDEAKILVEELYLAEFVEEIYLQKLNDIGMMAKLEGVPTSGKELDISQEIKQESQLSSQSEELVQSTTELPCQISLPCNNHSLTNDDTHPCPNYLPDIGLAKIFSLLLQLFHQFSGINVILLYGVHLVSDINPKWKKEIPILINSCKIIAGLLATLLINRYGRRYLLIRGSSILFTSLIGLFICYSIEQKDNFILQVLIIVFFLTFMCTFVTTLGPITWLYIPEIIQPPSVPHATMVNWSIACLVITLFPMLKHHSAKIFLFFAIMMLCNIVMCWTLMVETKDKNEEEIREELSKKDRKVREKLNEFFGRFH